MEHRTPDFSRFFEQTRQVLAQQGEETEAQRLQRLYIKKCIESRQPPPSPRRTPDEAIDIKKLFEPLIAEAPDPKRREWVPEIPEGMQPVSELILEPLPETPKHDIRSDGRIYKGHGCVEYD